MAEEPQPDGPVEEINRWLEHQPYKLAVVNPFDIVLAEKNARYMTHETFTTLVRNIERDGGLSSIPFCWFDGERYHALSGNHRVEGARVAEIGPILVLYTDEELSRQEKIAIQLSHNAIVGQDEPTILAELWQELQSVDLKMYSGLDDKAMKTLVETAVPMLSDVQLDFRTIAFVFLPEEPGRIDDAFQHAKQQVNVREGYLGRVADFDRLLEALALVQSSYRIKNTATALMLVLDIFEAHRLDLMDGWVDGEELKHRGRYTVPLASILGVDTIPGPAALIIKKAVDKMQSLQEVTQTNRWQALEYWAADYLAGPEDVA